jgi:hypothetical protein
MEETAAGTPGVSAGEAQAASAAAAPARDPWDEAKAAAFAAEDEAPDPGPADAPAAPAAESSPVMAASEPPAEAPVAYDKPGKPKRTRLPFLRLPPALAGSAGRIAGPFRRVPASLASITLAVVVVGGMVLEREPIVRGFPEMAALYRVAGLSVNLRGLELRNITSEIVREGEARVLVIEGEIANPQDRVLSVPLLALRVAGARSEPLYEWTSEPQKPKLSPGDSLRFRARLVSPPAEGREVLVRFTSRAADAASGAGTSASPAASGDAARP